MKKMFFIMIFCLIPAMIFATDFYLGPKAGFNFCKAYGSGVSDYEDAYNTAYGIDVSNSTAMSMNFGAFSNFRFNEQFALQIELLLTTNKLKLKDGDDYGEISQFGADLPVLCVYYIDNFYLAGGLGLFIPMGDSEWEYEINGTKDSTEDDTGDVNTGLLLGAGYNVPFDNGYLGFEGRLFLGLSDIDSDIDDIKERKISFNVCYGFQLN